MAHLHFKRTTYPSGGSASAGRVAYVTRQPVKELTRAEQQLRYIGHDDGQGQRREDLVYTNHRNLPAFAKESPHTYFQAAERYEGKNRIAFEEWKISLPRELSHGQNLALARDMLDASLGDTHPYVMAFHDPPAADGARQPHIHVLLSARTLDGIDRPPDQFFKRYNAKQPARGGARKAPELSHMGAVFAARQMLCDLTNVHLEQHGHAARLDPHSLADRGIDRAPEPKLLPSDSHRLTHHAEVTPTMQEVFTHRYARAPHVDTEQTQAARAWDVRKVELGISPTMDLDVALQRIREARERAVERKPERQVQRTISPGERTLTVQVQDLEMYQRRLTIELAIERQHASVGQERSRPGQRHVEHLLAQGTRHGLPPERPSRTPALGRLTGALERLSDEGEEPHGGGGLRFRLLGERDRERDDDRGTSW